MTDDSAQAMSEGMSAERLAEIRKTARRGDQHLVVLGDCDNECAACAVDELLAEVERLHSRAKVDVSVKSLAKSLIRSYKEQRDELRARLDEIGETSEVWAVRFCDDEGSHETRVRPSEYYARKTLDWARAFDPEAKLLQRWRGQWREVPHA